MNEADVENAIQEKGLTAPRITPARIEELMSQVTYHFYVIPGTCTTVCTAISHLGFTMATEISACVSPENFDPTIGEEIAKANASRAARNAFWKLEGYALLTRLHGEAL